MCVGAQMVEHASLLITPWSTPHLLEQHPSCAGFEAEEEAQREASRHIEPASPSRLPTIREVPSQRSLPLPAESLPRDERTLREAASLLSASVPAALQRQPSLPRPISLGNLRGAGRAQRHVLATSEVGGSAWRSWACCKVLSGSSQGR